MITEEMKLELFAAARKAIATSYAPYSRFRVGAALLTEKGSLYTGVNVENRSYGLTNCAERSAIFSAVTHGETSFMAIAVYCPDADYPVPPCGACRQVISEFASADFPVFFAGREGAFTEIPLGRLFPFDSLHELKK